MNSLVAYVLILIQLFLVGFLFVWIAEPICFMILKGIRWILQLIFGV